MFFKKEKVQMMETMQNCLEEVKSNNSMLANTLKSVIEIKEQAQQIQQIQLLPVEDPKKVDPWVAAYALNLCTVSVSQIIQYNDLRFMEQEYENILNNLNLEMMPKDETLLDTLKQILDVINFFRIQDKEKKLLEKEYQQKLKDAIWSAAPNPSVIIAGGSKGGLIGLAASAAISAGTGYMNYRKEKAKIKGEQERKEWELERSAMEQLHGLQRQLFETAWRLADEYGFTDKLRLTERQIKQFNEIIIDDDYLRRYERLEYISKNFEAYPPFWYYMGSAALHVAYEYGKDDEGIYCEYLKRAYDCFNMFFEKSKTEQKLLREDPVVAQCAFEFIAVLNKIEEMGFVFDKKSEEEGKIDKRVELLNVALNSSGNALDVLQQCALNYLALDNPTKAIEIMKALINERYNVSSNIQLLSALYVDQFLKGNEGSKTAYNLLNDKTIYETNIYPWITDEADKENADKKFLIKQKIYLAEKYLTTLEEYIENSKQIFAEILDRDYDISEDLMEFFRKMVRDVRELFYDSSESYIITAIKESDLKKGLKERSERKEYEYDNLFLGSYQIIITEMLDSIDRIKEMKETSDFESRVLKFCEKEKITSEKLVLAKQQHEATKTLESALFGNDANKYKEKRELFTEYLDEAIKFVEKENELIEDTREVEYFTERDRTRFNAYKAINQGKIRAAEIFAVIKDKKNKPCTTKKDLVFTTEGLYVLESNDNKRNYKYSGNISLSEKENSLIIVNGDKARKIYAQPGINYAKLYEMVSKFKEIEENNNKKIENNKNNKINLDSIVAEKIKQWKAESESIQFHS